jgi:hypothetical protein
MITFHLRPSGRPNSRAGYALVVVLVLLSVSAVILACTLGRANTTETLNYRNNQYAAGLYAAEAATEKVIAQMQYDFLAGNLGSVTNDLARYRVTVPNGAETPIWNSYQFSDGQGNLNRTYVQCISNSTWAPLQSQYSGLNGWVTTYRVLSNAKVAASRFQITNAVQQDIQLFGIPIFQFAIFYNSLLEFTWCAPFIVNGRTHSNTNIFVGSSSALTYNSTVTASGTVSSPAWFGKTTNQYTGKVTYNGSPGYSTNVQTLSLPVGTNNTAAAVREIINQPPDGEDINSPMGQQRYLNKADIVLLVSNSTVTATLKTAPDDGSPTIITAYYNPTNLAATNFSAISSNFPFLSLTNGNASPGWLTFTDQREGKTVLTTQIDVGKLNRWIATNPLVNAKFSSTAGVYNNGAYPNILYAADNRPGNATNLPSIRLMDASIVPTNMAPSGQPTGFTVATPNPLYIWGNYNCPDSSALNTTNTTKTFPASLISDSLTVLSANWLDSESSLSLGTGGKNSATSTTINAAILTGNVSTTGSDVNSFSGGVQNLTRLLEDWGNGGSVTLTVNTSMVNLFTSTRATTQFQAPGVYYYAPSRQFSFDRNFMVQNKLPPGTPMLGSILRSKWAVPPPNTVTYAGN